MQPNAPTSRLAASASTSGHRVDLNSTARPVHGLRIRTDSPSSTGSQSDVNGDPCTTDPREGVLPDRSRERPCI